MVRVAIHGAAGRMGRRLIAVGHDDADVEIVGAIESDSHPLCGQDAGTVAGIEPIDVPLSENFPNNVDVVIDFSVHQALDGILQRCVEKSVPLVIATTGLSDSQQDAIRSAAKELPIVWAPSMSLTVNLTMKLTEIASAALARQGQRVDVEIIERHHRFKADAPSGTALRFGELVSKPLHLDSPTHGREGLTGERPANQLGYHAVRVGDNPGEHTIIFGMLGETMELRVAASNRDCYALGAFSAAKYLVDKEAGLYNMYDVLGL